MEFDEFVNLVKENCPEIMRTCWKPFKAKVPSRSSYATKFGGSDPFRGTNFSWPRCEEKTEDRKCEKQKEFICQINLAELPDKVKSHIGKDSGLIQCFWCTNCDQVATAYLIPRSEMIPSLQTLAAITVFETKANIDNLPGAIKTLVEKTNKVFDGGMKKNMLEEKQVEAWEESEVKEIPTYAEMYRNDKIAEKILAMPGMDEQLYEQIDKNLFSDTENPIFNHGIKLAGWLYMMEPMDCGWDVGYPTCPDCEVDMDVTFLQLHADGDFMSHDWYTDYGIAWVTLCPGCGKPAMFVQHL